ncbi:YraN family protein [Novosphingobium tardum]|jgi:putative endonuclease|uniref:UPF0102 protein ACFO0A_09085 n=1 Tax=Novosphingobium tardum TaxID=1538021 RepID=A0ABV8RPK9_9SPHN
MNRAEAERRGRRAETLAAWWLRLRGWRILGRRLRVSAGEVDIVARKRRTVAFCEVKWRATATERDWAVDERRLQRVARAAEALAPRFVRPDDELRIDVLLLAPGTLPRRIANAWQPLR